MTTMLPVGFACNMANPYMGYFIANDGDAAYGRAITIALRISTFTPEV